nr:hypothetical protein [Thalassorhabdomicrobium marinisediminis]
MSAREIGAAMTSVSIRSVTGSGTWMTQSHQSRSVLPGQSAPIQA